MKQLAIIADDLSSATDCGIQVARSGLQTLVPLGTYRLREESQIAEVLSLDTDSRAMTAVDAYKEVHKAASAVLEAGYPTIYKSFDSTLRGNLGAEVDAVLDTSSFDFAVIAPAYPLYGRTTLGGCHFLRGVPINQTEFAKDPQSPVTKANLIEIFSMQSGRAVGLVDLDTLRTGVDGVAIRLKSLLRQGMELIVFDAQEEDDLDRIAATVRASGYRVLWVGSTGFARCLPSAIGAKVIDTAQSQSRSTNRLSMLVSGSTSEVNREQLLQFQKLDNVRSVEIDPVMIISGGEMKEKEITRCRDRLLHALEKGNDVALHVPSSRVDVAKTQSKGLTLGMHEIQVASAIVDALAEVTLMVAERFLLGGLILTGGATAKAICRKMGGVAIRIIKEVESGIPLCQLLGSKDVLLVIKAGAFGNSKSLINSLKALEEGDLH